MSSRVRAWLFVSVAVVVLSTAVADAGVASDRNDGAGQAKRSTVQVFNDCDAGFKRVVGRRGHAFVAVAFGVSSGCARWDCGVGWRAQSPYADGADAVFVVNQKQRSGRTDHRGCEQNTGSLTKPRHYDQHDDDENDTSWWRGRGPRIDAVLGNLIVPPASPSPTPVKVLLTPTTTKGR